MLLWPSGSAAPAGAAGGRAAARAGVVPGRARAGRAGVPAGRSKAMATSWWRPPAPAELKGKFSRARKSKGAHISPPVPASVPMRGLLKAPLCLRTGFPDQGSLRWPSSPVRCSPVPGCAPHAASGAPLDRAGPTASLGHANPHRIGTDRKPATWLVSRSARGWALARHFMKSGAEERAPLNAWPGSHGACQGLASRRKSAVG